MLYCLQGGRALAALIVVLYHLGVIFASDKYWGVSPLGDVFAFGHAGVYFFFVLSGFIIAYVHARDLGVRERLRPYLASRARRIYPIYWLVLAPLLAVYAIFPGFGVGYEREPLVIFSSITLLHFTSPTVLAVAWTLYYEVLFYLLFAIAIVSRRAGIALLVVWQLASLLLPNGFLLATLNLLFGAGMLAAWLVGRRAVPAPMLVAAAGVVIFTAAGIDEDYGSIVRPGLRVFVYGLGSFLAVIGAVELERQAKLSIAPFWRRLGDASYVLYLIHYPLISLLARLLLHVPIAPLLSYVLVLGVVVAGALALHTLVERPLLAWLGRARSPGVVRA